jgi:hypothetical protein
VLRRCERAGRDHERRVRMAEVLEAERLELGAAHGGPEDAGHEVVLAPDGSVRRREDEPELVRGAGEEVLAEDAQRLTGEANLSPAGGRLSWDELPLARTCLDSNCPGRQVERPVAEGE